MLLWLAPPVLHAGPAPLRRGGRGYVDELVSYLALVSAYPRDGGVLPLGAEAAARAARQSTYMDLVTGLSSDNQLEFVCLLSLLLRGQVAVAKLVGMEHPHALSRLLEDLFRTCMGRNAHEGP